MNRRRLLGVIVALTLGAGIVAWGTWCCLRWMVNRQMASQNEGSLWASATWPTLLKLHEEQKIKIQPLEKNLKKDLDQLEIERTQKLIGLCQLLMSPQKPDPGTLSHSLDEVWVLEKQKEEKMLNHLLALKEILDPQQQSLLLSTMMQDICRGCRKTTGIQKDHCGLCQLQG